MIEPSEKKLEVPAPWDDEVYTEMGVEYRNFYPVEEETKDEED